MGDRTARKWDDIRWVVVVVVAVVANTGHTYVPAIAAHAHCQRVS